MSGAVFGISDTCIHEKHYVLLDVSENESSVV